MRLPDVDNGRLLGYKYKLICCFKLMVDMFGGDFREFVNDIERTAFLEREVMGLGVDRYW